MLHVLRRTVAASAQLGYDEGAQRARLSELLRHVGQAVEDRRLAGSALLRNVLNPLHM